MRQAPGKNAEAVIYRENWRILGILVEEDHPPPVVNDAVASWNLRGHSVQVGVKLPPGKSKNSKKLPKVVQVGICSWLSPVKAARIRATRQK